jgi:hypothetical protein
MVPTLRQRTGANPHFGEYCCVSDDRLGSGASARRRKVCRAVRLEKRYQLDERVLKCALRPDHNLRGLNAGRQSFRPNSHRAANHAFA